jgi:alpha-beta hydrolase superfamily lysophospholipase
MLRSWAFFRWPTTGGQVVARLVVFFAGCLALADVAEARPKVSAEAPWLSAAARGRALAEWPSPSGRALPSGYVFPVKTGRPRAVVVCLHGIQTHGAWFSLLAEPLNAGGVTLFCPNRRGSGGAAKVARVDGYGTWLDELDTVVAAARAQGAPVWLLGTSWGAKLALAYAGEHPDRIAGVVLLVPALATSVEKPSDRLLAMLLYPVAWWWPKTLPLDPKLYPPQPARPVQRGVPPPLERFPARDRQLLADMERDPWIVQCASIHCLVTASAMQTHALKRWRQLPPRERPPLHAIFAGEDQIVLHAETSRCLAGLAHGEEIVPTAGHAAQVQSVPQIAARIFRLVRSPAFRPSP